MNLAETTYGERLAAEATRVRESGDLGRSEPLIRLFDYLLARSLEGQTPREIEIAQEVFAKREDFDVMLDASVRVYIHRLRRKLGEHYARATEAGDRLSIPLGEYRLVLATPEDAEAAAAAPAALAPASPVDAAPQPGWRRRLADRPFVALVIGLVLLNLVCWAIYSTRPPVGAGPVLNKLWKPLLDNRRPMMVVLGDYYVYGEASDGIVVTRLVRDFAINSRADLDAYLLLNPDKVGQNMDLDLHYLPVSTGMALRSILPTVNAAAMRSSERPPVEAMSDVKPDVFKAANIVYIGFLSGLGPLQDPLFRASGFRLGEDFDELVDKASGRRFRSDWSLVAAGKVPQRDYGYIASLIGPTGNRIVIVAGTRDAAVVQMAEIAADRAQLDAIDTRTGDGAFEALFEVRTQGNLNLGSSLVLARPIRDGGIWQPGDIAPSSPVPATPPRPAASAR